MTARDADTIALADRIERGLLYLMGDGPLLESEHCLIVAALRANRAVADLEAENQELRVLLADERAAHRVCVEMRDEAERKKAEIERLRERCDAYKGQVEAGSIAIQHLQGEIARLRDALKVAAQWVPLPDQSYTPDARRDAEIVQDALTRTSG